MQKLFQIQAIILLIFCFNQVAISTSDDNDYDALQSNFKSNIHFLLNKLYLS